MKRNYEITKLPTETLRDRRRVPVKRNDPDDQLRRLEYLNELSVRDKWEKPPTRRPWTALADEAPTEGEPVLWWAPGGFGVPGTFVPGSVFVAYYSATERENGFANSKWSLTECGSYAEDSFPHNVPTHWRPLPPTR